MDLTEAEDIKKGWQEYTELYKKDLHDPDNHDGVITHLEPDILECEVEWALRSITIFFVKFFLKFYFIFKLYIIVLVLPNIKMNPSQVYMCSPS